MRACYIRWLLLALFTAQASWLLAETPSENWSLVSQQAVYLEGSFRQGDDMSAAALTPHGIAYLASDETRGLEQVSVLEDGRHLISQGYLPLGEQAGVEYDLEAMAWSLKDHHLYVTGSHSLTRKKGRYHSERFRLFRIPVAEDGSLLLAKREQASLEPHLKAFAAAQLSQEEQAQIDIEGLCENDGTLWFGLRAPNLNGTIPVFEITSKALFESRMEGRWHKFAIHPSTGIRDMAFTQHGMLLLLGPSRTIPTSSNQNRLCLWQPQNSEICEILTLPPRENGMPEAILILEENPSELHLLIFYDGLLNGSPRKLYLRKKSLPQNRH